MSVLDDIARALLGVSAYAPPRSPWALNIDDPSVVRAREAQGGQLQPLPVSSYRWYFADIETAAHQADVGDLAMAAQLCRAMRQDGTFAGLLGQRTSGLVRLPIKFYGREDIVTELESRNGTRSVFWEMHPPGEIAQLAADGVMLGVGVAERVPVPGRQHPVLVRLDPQFLVYRWTEARWYYRSTAGLIQITPGDGRWVLHVPGGRLAPWQHGLWQACGRAFVQKTHAQLHRANYSAKLANPARVAVTPAATTEEQRTSWLRKVMAWGINTVFAMPPGYDVKLLESKGEGYQVFEAEEASADRTYMITLAGQVVTTTGGAGFANADIHKSIRADLIKDTGDALAYTLNTQSIPPWVIDRYGIDALDETAIVEWDTTPPKDVKTEAEALEKTALAIGALRTALAEHGRVLDIDQLAQRFGVPIVAGATAMPTLDTLRVASDLAKSAGLKPTDVSVRAILEALGLKLEDLPTEARTVRLDLAPTDIAKVVTVDEARGSQGLPPIGDERGPLTINQLELQSEAQAEPTAGPTGADELPAVA